jgi:hypothetical protein
MFNILLFAQKEIKGSCYKLNLLFIYTLNMIMKLIAGLALNSEPWDKFSYSFSGYTGTGILIGREEMMVVTAFWLRLRGLYFPLTSCLLAAIFHFPMRHDYKTQSWTGCKHTTVKLVLKNNDAKTVQILT